MSVFCERAYVINKRHVFVDHTGEGAATVVPGGTWCLSIRTECLTPAEAYAVVYTIIMFFMVQLLELVNFGRLVVSAGRQSPGILSGMMLP